MKHLQVAVGIIRNESQQIFLAQRPATSPMANMWEFPGGKIEPDETPAEALKRELLEETGITVIQATPYEAIDHTYNDLQVRLYFFIVDDWRGEPWGREGQPSRWVSQADLIAEEFPPANAEIVERLKAESR